MRPDGTVKRYKARLIAKGFTQIYDIDYMETFAPMAKLNTARVLLSLAAKLDWPLQQLNINNAFLNGEVDEKNKVCKLKKSLYGLSLLEHSLIDL